MKKLFLTFVLAAFFLFPAVFAEAKDFELTNAYATVEKQKISLLIRSTDGSYTVFLPACADSSVKFTIGGQKFTVDCSRETATAGDYKINVVRGSLSSIFITLDGGNGELTRIGKSKSEFASGNAVLLSADGNLIYDGPLDKMWAHGNSSFKASSDASEKISYNLKLGKKAELIGDSGKLKKYVLISPRRKDKPYDRDTTGMAQLSAFEVCSALADGERPDVKGMYVDLYVNGEYRGFYVLAERINNGGALELAKLEDCVTGATNTFVKVDKQSAGPSDTAVNAGIECYSFSENASVPSGTDISGGYILEVTCGDMYVGCGFKTALGTLVNIKYPDYCSREMVMYIATRVQEFENAICSKTGYYNGKHFSEYGDLRSLADQVLTYGFFLNFEIYQTSTYIYKDAGDVPLTFGPGWDYEGSVKDLTTVDSVFDTVFSYYAPIKCAFLQQIWKWGEFMKIVDEENRKMSDIILSLTKKGSILYNYADSVQNSVTMNAAIWEDAVLTYSAYDYINAISSRYSTWYGKFWNPEKYLIWTETEVADNGDGTVTISLKSKGDISKPVWRVLEDGLLSVFDSAVYSITVPADGKLYMCSVNGKLNAYFSKSSSDFFNSRVFEMTTYPVAAGIPSQQSAIESGSDTFGQSDSEASNRPAKEKIPIYVLLPVIICVLAATVTATIISLKKA